MPDIGAFLPVILAVVVVAYALAKGRKRNVGVGAPAETIYQSMSMELNSTIDGQAADGYPIKLEATAKCSVRNPGSKSAREIEQADDVINQLFTDGLMGIMTANSGHVLRTDSDRLTAQLLSKLAEDGQKFDFEFSEVSYKVL